MSSGMGCNSSSDRWAVRRVTLLLRLEEEALDLDGTGATGGGWRGGDVNSSSSSSPQPTLGSWRGRASVWSS